MSRVVGLGGAVHWPYRLEDVSGLIVVLAVILIYGSFFAFTRANRLGWAATALVAALGIAALVGASRGGDAAYAGPTPAPSACDCDTADALPRPASAIRVGQHLL